MPWPSTEYAEPFVTNPGAIAVLGDYMLVANSSYGGTSGTYAASQYFSIFHIPSRTGRMFGGLSGSGSKAATATGGLFWVVSASGSSQINSVNPVTGAVGVHLTVGNTAKVVAPSSNHLASIRGIYTISTNTLTASPTLLSSSSAIGVHSGRLFCLTNTHVQEIAVPGGGLIGSWAHGGSGVRSSQVGCVSGSRIYWDASAGAANVLAWFDVATNTAGVTTITPPLAWTAITESDLAALGGKVYILTNTLALVAIDPVTGAATSDTLADAGTRVRRRNIVSAAGKLWIPAGDPAT